MTRCKYCNLINPDNAGGCMYCGELIATQDKRDIKNIYGKVVKSHYTLKKANEQCSKTKARIKRLK